MILAIYIYIGAGRCRCNIIYGDNRRHDESIRYDPYDG